jgi:malonyl CoA-acyl carrier protein transacylase
LKSKSKGSTDNAQPIVRDRISSVLGHSLGEFSALSTIWGRSSNAVAAAQTFSVGDVFKAVVRVAHG